MNMITSSPPLLGSTLPRTCHEVVCAPPLPSSTQLASSPKPIPNSLSTSRNLPES